MIDYVTLRVIWWLIMGILLIGFAIMDGFDLGVATLLPFLAKNDLERRVVINTVGPVWEGNQVWIILGGGVLFAAWPYLYAVSFSGFYYAILLVLLAFIMRPVGFKYRSKIENPNWRSTWDWILCLSGLIITLTFGVAVGNVLQGVPFYFADNLRSFYTGTFWALFNPFALICGLTSIALLTMQGAAYLALKTETIISARARKSARISAILLILLFALAGIWIIYGINGYRVDSAIDFAGVSNPLHKTVVLQSGAWIMNYTQHPLWLIAPILGFLGALCVLALNKVLPKFAFFMSSVSILGVISTVGLSMFPFILPSSSNPQSSLLVWDASASQLSLSIMLGCVIIFLPIILIYTAFVYRVLRGKVTGEYINRNKDSY
jgi:cytochrome d ubiquinol oxidase subunit II